MNTALIIFGCYVLSIILSFLMGGLFRRLPINVEDDAPNVEEYDAPLVICIIPFVNIAVPFLYFLCPLGEMAFNYLYDKIDDFFSGPLEKCSKWYYNRK